MRAVSWLGVACLTACNWGPERPDVPGDDLGTFGVAATLERSDCGQGALAPPEQWDFEVRLSRQDGTLFWGNGREVIPGTIDDTAGTFAFATRVAVELEPAQGADPGCTVLRDDAASGTVTGSDLDVTGLEGSLSYEYSAAEGADCLDALIDGTVATLPCSIDFSLRAEREIAPASLESED